MATLIEDHTPEELAAALADMRHHEDAYQALARHRLEASRNLKPSSPAARSLPRTQIEPRASDVLTEVQYGASVDEAKADLQSQIDATVARLQEVGSPKVEAALAKAAEEQEIVGSAISTIESEVAAVEAIENMSYRAARLGWEAAVIRGITFTDEDRNSRVTRIFNAFVATQESHATNFTWNEYKSQLHTLTALTVLKPYIDGAASEREAAFNAMVEEIKTDAKERGFDLKKILAGMKRNPGRFSDLARFDNSGALAAFYK